MGLSYEELKALVQLNRLFAGRSRQAVEFLKDGHSPLELLEKIRIENYLGKAENDAQLSVEFSADREIENAERKDVKLLTLFSADYPQALTHLIDPPLMLYAKGSFSETDEASLAIVGTRHPSFYGRAQAGRFSRELAAKGITIVSGLAQGIDQVAHHASLEVSFGRTIAVLGCGIDVVYPKSSQKLYDAIAERGVILSEYAFGAEPLAYHFPARNRIIAGLSLGVLVVEAHSRSGSLITANQAMEQGKEVFAIPGPIDQITSRGTNGLIKEGAALVETPEEIFETLAPNLWPLMGRESKSELMAGENAHLDQDELLGILAEGPKRFEDLLKQSQWSVSMLSQRVITLEIQGRIVRTSAGMYSAVKSRL